MRPLTCRLPSLFVSTLSEGMIRALFTKMSPFEFFVMYSGGLPAMSDDTVFGSRFWVYASVAAMDSQRVESFYFLMFYYF